MTFLPVASRELRVASRKAATYWSRFAFALVASVVVVGTLMAIRFSPSRSLPGRELFAAFSMFALYYCVFAGAGRTSDCLSSEKRNGTLGFLFLTDLRGYDIAFGKLMAALTELIFGLMAIFPVLAVILLMGGVSFLEACTTGLLLLNALWFSGTLGLLISSLSRSQQNAGMVAGFASVFFLWGIPALIEVANDHAQATGWVMVLHVLQFMNPYPMDALFGGMGLRGATAPLWIGLAGSHGLGWVWLGLASWILPRTWQEKPRAGGKNLTLRERWRQWTFGIGEPRTAHRQRLLEKSPFLWLTSRDRLQVVWPWLGMGLTALIVGGLVTWASGWKFDGLALMILSPAWYLIVKLGVSGSASRPIAEEKANATLELILSTPLTVGAIARGQWLALKRQFLGPALATLALLVVTTVVMGFFPETNRPDEQLRSLTFGLAVCVMFVVDLAALGWAGLWFGLVSKDPKQASANTYGGVLLLPNLVMLLWTAAIGILHGVMRWQPPGFYFYLGSWFFFGIVNSVLHFVICRRLFYSRIREIAAARYAPPGLSFWGRLGRKLGLLFRP